MSRLRRLSLKNGKLCRELIPITDNEETKVFDGQVSKEHSFGLTSHCGDRLRLVVNSNGIRLDRSGSRLSHDHAGYQTQAYNRTVHYACIHHDSGILELVLNKGEYVITEQF